MLQYIKVYTSESTEQLAVSWMVRDLIPRGSNKFIFAKSHPDRPWGALSHQRVQGVYSGVRPRKRCTNFPPPSSTEFRKDYSYISTPLPTVLHGVLYAEIYLLSFYRDVALVFKFYICLILSWTLITNKIVRTTSINRTIKMT